MDEHLLWLGRKQIELAAQALRKHGFDVTTLDTKEEVKSAVLEMIPLSASVGVPGTITIREIGLLEALAARGNRVIHHWIPGMSVEEDRQARIQEMNADILLTSANAVTLDGSLVNIDSVGNRAASMLFGPSRVVVVAGSNKIVKDVPSAITRIKNVAAPMNAHRLGSKTPCATLGYCTECDTPGRICKVTTIIDHGPSKNQFDIILMTEHAGF